MPTASIVKLRRAIWQLADPETAQLLQRFFKTGEGEYGAGDRFLGIRVPALRRLARTYWTLPLASTLELLRSPWHEERLLALLLFVEQYRRGDQLQREEIFQVYLAHTRFINNWDLVDASAEHIVGEHLDPDQTGVLEKLACFGSTWERRIAVLATFYWVKRGEFRPTLRIAERLVSDSHDLIHKAVGWMLREIGKRDREQEECFLRRHYRAMPRTMLRYAIERFPEHRRRQYLRREV
jgi:3-methyladenine DNA glycosylase AlkD